MTQTVEAPESTSTDTPENQAHMVSCPDDQPSTAEWLALARLKGVEVEAVCGFKFVPKRNPKKFRVCTACTTEAGNRLFGGPK